MKMALLYNDTCPQDYEPPGFHADNDPKSLISSNKGSKIGSMNTGFHGYHPPSKHVRLILYWLHYRISVNLFQRDPQNSQSSQLSSKRSRIRLRSLSISSETDGGGTQDHGLRLLQGMVLSPVVSVSALIPADFWFARGNTEFEELRTHNYSMQKLPNNQTEMKPTQFLRVPRLFYPTRRMWSVVLMTSVDRRSTIEVTETMI